MKETQRRESKSHDVIQKPPLAMVVKGDGHAAKAAGKSSAKSAAQAGPEREARIREAAYARYESRGRVDGHDLDDWLAAEAAVPE